MRALFFLVACRLRNSIRRIPRNPRLALPLLFFLIIGAAQLLPLVMLHQLGSHHHAPTTRVPSAALEEGGPGALIAAMRLVLLLSVFTAILGALQEGNLFFEPSDIDFLFPSPLSRRAVLLFRMTGRYAGLFVPSVYLPLVLGGFAIAAEAGISAAALWPGMMGSWLFLVSVANFAQVSVLGRWSHDDSPTSERRRRRARNVIVAMLGGCALIGGVAVIRILTGRSYPDDFRGLLRLINGPAVTVALAPLGWAAGLFRVAFKGWTIRSAGRLTGLFGIAALSVVALYGRERDFYDGAPELSSRRARTQTALRTGDTGALLAQMAQDGTLARGRTLPAVGGGARALLWKDLIGLTRTPARGWTNLLLIAVFPALIGLAAERKTGLSLLLWVLAFSLQMSGVFLSGIRNVARRADLTKTLPITPIRFLAAELALPVAQLTLLGWFSLTILILTGSATGSIVPITYIFFPSLAALLIVIQTALVLLYPQRNDAAQGAVSNLLGFAASVAALVPAAIIGLVLHFLGAPYLVLGLVGGVVNLVMTATALAATARLWARFEPTA
jgi:hypothetical protein